MIVFFFYVYNHTMDAITDILSTIFVSKRHRNKQPQLVVRKDQQTQVSEDTSLSGDSSHSEYNPNTRSDDNDDTFSSTSRGTLTTDVISWCDLRAEDMLGKNIVIFNRTTKDKVQVLSEVLLALSSLDDVDELYNKKICVLTSQSNKKYFTKMLLENPHIYFDLEFKEQGVSDPILSKKVSSTPVLKTIWIVDDESTWTNNIVVDKSTQIVWMTSSFAEEIIQSKVMKRGDSHDVIVIHKNEKTQSSYKMFFNDVFMKLCAPCTLGFDEFLQNIHGLFALRYLIVADKKLRYK